MIRFMLISQSSHYNNLIFFLRLTPFTKYMILNVHVDGIIEIIIRIGRNGLDRAA